MKTPIFVPPLWKVRRELLRVGSQADSLLFRTIGYSAIQGYQRAVIGRKRKIFKGDLAIGTRAALYLIFPKEGVQRSHIVALDYMISCGYIPVVISNQPLRPEDLNMLTTKSAMVMVRPNFGYDFGGYQDGMRAIAPYLQQLDQFTILNDSCWFPLHPNVNWFELAEANPADFVGAAAHEGMTTETAIDFAKETWVMNRSRELFHISSFALHFKSRLLHSPEFQAFWDDYEPTSYKTLTILRGEIGLTQHIMRSGFDVAVTQDTTHLDKLLDALPDERLIEIAKNLVFHRFPELSPFLSNPIKDRFGWRNLILTTVARQGPSYALLDYEATERQGIFVKKAPLSWTQTSAEASLRILDKFDSRNAEIFREEAGRIWARKAESLRNKAR